MTSWRRSVPPDRRVEEADDETTQAILDATQTISDVTQVLLESQKDLPRLVNNLMRAKEKATLAGFA